MSIVYSHSDGVEVIEEEKKKLTKNWFEIKKKTSNRVMLGMRFRIKNLLDNETVGVKKKC